jgi:hypothetical protein
VPGFPCSREAQNHAAHVSLLCQRRAGELLAATPMAKNQHGAGHTMRPAPKLSDLGVSRIDSQRWQKVAAVPEAEFEAHVEAEAVPPPA